MNSPLHNVHLNVYYMTAYFKLCRLIKIKEEMNVRPGFQYCRYAGSFGPPIAEYVIAYMVAHERNMRMTFNLQAKSEW